MKIPANLLACLLALLPISILAAEPELTPPDQDYYFHFTQRPNFCCGNDGLVNGLHNIAFVANWANPTVQAALTVETWVYCESSDLEEIALATGLDIDRMTLFCNQRAWGFQRRSYGANGWTFFLQTDAGTYTDTGDIPLPLEQWTHLAATYDGAMIRTYLNGVLQTSTAASGDIPEVGDAFPEQCIWGTDEPNDAPSGMFAIGTGLGFTGGLRQLRIWDRALSAAELTTNAGIQLQGTEPGLRHYWPINEQTTFNDFGSTPNKVDADLSLVFGPLAAGKSRTGVYWNHCLRSGRIWLKMSWSQAVRRSVRLPGLWSMFRMTKTWI